MFVATVFDVPDRLGAGCLSVIVIWVWVAASMVIGDGVAVQSMCQVAGTNTRPAWAVPADSPRARATNRASARTCLIGGRASRFRVISTVVGNARRARCFDGVPWLFGCEGL